MKSLFELNGGNPPFVVIVDDVVKNLRVLGTMLEEEDFDVAVAQDGLEAIEMIKADPPDLILLDIMMPEMNGWQVCEKLKASEITREIPVIFLTAKTETEDIVKGFQIGGVDYVTKPFNKEELLVRIKTHLELKFARDVIVKQNIELKELNKEKNEFLGIAAHDLKNPLSGIKGLSELIALGDLSEEEVIDFANHIKSSSEFMFNLITDLLDINSIEEGKLNLHYDNFEVQELLITAVKEFKARAEAKNIELLHDFQTEGVNIHADPGKARQIVENIISNAIKFSPFDKRVWLRSYISENGTHAVIEVQDEGPGISEEDKRKLFGKFARLSARPTGEEHSTGLGLSIVKKLVEAMDGSIRCESILDEGSTFIFTFAISNL